MPKETIEQVNQKTGMGNILISAYKYLKDKGILVGSGLSNPLITQKKARIPTSTHMEKLALNSAFFNNTPMFSYKNISTDKEIRVMTFNVAVKSIKPVSFDIYKNATLTGAVWSAFNSSTIIQKDTSATAYTGGKLVGGVDVPETGGVYITLGDEPVIFSCMPGDIITFAPTTDLASDIYFRIRLEEI